MLLNVLHFVKKQGQIIISEFLLISKLSVSLLHPVQTNSLDPTTIVMSLYTNENIKPTIVVADITALHNQSTLVQYYSLLTFSRVNKIKEKQRIISSLCSLQFQIIT
jgi:hypothetical protein